ncbi:MAG: glycosyltransferase family 4 protein [bacterium]|nr:glycosyltransferase family 4 protein [bacterium]
MAAPTRLLFVVTEDWYFCSHRLTLGGAAREAGYDVAVATRVRDHGDQITARGLRLLPFPMTRRGANPLTELATLVRLVRLYRRERPDIVHHVALKPVVYGSLAARLAGVPVVVNAVAGTGWLFNATGGARRLLRPVMRRVLGAVLAGTQVIVQNPDDAEVMAGIDLQHVHLIRGAGVDTREFAPRDEAPGPIVVLLASRLLWTKGVGDFAVAARLLRERGVAVRCVLVGTPDPDNPDFVPEGAIRAWEAEGSLEWWGHRGNMADVFAAAHIVCLPSYYGEGVPKALIEAAACGRPIVTTDMPGCREIVRQRENGLLVPPRDPARLADALQELAGDADLRRRLGAEGRRRVESEFSEQQVIAATLAVYRRAPAP